MTFGWFVFSCICYVNIYISSVLFYDRKHFCHVILWIHKFLCAFLWTFLNVHTSWTLQKWGLTETKPFFFLRWQLRLEEKWQLFSPSLPFVQPACGRKVVCWFSLKIFLQLGKETPGHIINTDIRGLLLFS